MATRSPFPRRRQQQSPDQQAIHHQLLGEQRQSQGFSFKPSAASSFGALHPKKSFSSPDLSQGELEPQEPQTSQPTRTDTMSDTQILLRGDVEAAFADLEEQIWRMATCRSLSTDLDLRSIFDHISEEQAPTGSPLRWALTRIRNVADAQEVKLQMGGNDEDKLEPLSLMIRTARAARSRRRSSSQGSLLAVDLLRTDKAEFMYGGGDFDSSWGAAGRLLLSAIPEMASYLLRDDPDVDPGAVQGRKAGEIHVSDLATHTIYRMAESFWLTLYTELEDVAKKCALRAEEVAERARSRMDAAVTLVRMQEPEQQQQDEEMEDEDMEDEDTEEDDDEEDDEQQQQEHQQQQQQQQPPAANPVTEAAREETCHYRVLREWLRNTVRDPATTPRVYCPICREDLVVDSLRLAGLPPRWRHAATMEAGVVLEGCQHILGDACFGVMRDEAGHDFISCPMCREPVDSDYCETLQAVLDADFLEIAVEQRELMADP